MSAPDGTGRRGGIAPSPTKLEASSSSTMQPRFRCFAAVAATLGLLASHPVRAEEAAVKNGWSFALTPYLWIAGISGTVNTPFQRVPEQKVEADFGDVLSNISGLAFMGAGEVRYGRFGLIGDITTLTLESDVATPRGQLFSGGKGRVSATTGMVLGSWRALEDGKNTLDLAAGVRPWSLTTKLTLEQGLLPGRTVKPSASWVDPLLGLRYSRRLGANWSATLYGDIGGFGAGSEFTWELFGSVNYQVTDAISLRVGYRHMQVDHRHMGTETNINLSGPIIGATFRF
jgi:hypothetical protein